MQLTSHYYSVELHPKINAIERSEWDACVASDNPFVSYDFLWSLEESGSVGQRTGWLARHAAFRDETGNLAAVVPLYIKYHSYGEYVFDQSWGQAFESAGGTYYPKLQVASPFSPVTGPRLLVNPQFKISPEEVGDGLKKICEHLDVSSVHVTFCTEKESGDLSETGWLQRTGVQYHWHNLDYQTFDDFLGALRANHRKSIKRERRDANASGLSFATLRGSEIKERHWEAFYRFYQSTIDRKWGSAYLTPEFFPQLSQRMGDKVILMTASNGATLVAGALNLCSNDTLFGRNWGCVGTWPFLHFELCYYRAIDFAIEHRLKRVEAGAQGEHKIQRGYLPSLTHSAHFIRDHNFSDAVNKFLTKERAAIKLQLEELAGFSPFRHTEL